MKKHSGFKVKAKVSGRSPCLGCAQTCVGIVCGARSAPACLIRSAGMPQFVPVAGTVAVADAMYAPTGMGRRPHQVLYSARDAVPAGVVRVVRVASVS